MTACMACGFDAGQTKLDLSTRPKRGRIKARLRELLKAAQTQGLTVDELERLTPGVGHQSVSARVNELHNGGEVVASGKRTARSGKLATIYVWHESAVLPVVREDDGGGYDSYDGDLSEFDSVPDGT